MIRHEAYQILQRVLNAWNMKSEMEIMSQVGSKITTTELTESGEGVSVETVVRKVGDTVSICATAYGPSHWNLERYEESLRIYLQNDDNT